MSRGVLMYAHNNSEIDYLKIACSNALMVKKNLNVPVSLVTDEGSISWAKESLGEDFLNLCFENIILVQRDWIFKNTRNFADTSFSVKPLDFYNCNHWQAYELSPYDETLFIDCDYLIMSNELSKCWGSMNNVMISSNIYAPIDTCMPYSKKLDDIGIKLYWATAIYFKKSPLAENLFNLVKYIQDNYSYYCDLFHFSGKMFRNDYAFSVAVHILNGFSDISSVIRELPITGLLMAWDTNDIYSVNGINDITIYAEKKDEKGIYILTRFKNTDIHIMNKWAINRFSDRLINLYRGNK